MQETVNYLLCLPEFYCTHEFRPLYYANLCTEADSLLEQSILVGERASAPTTTAVMFARPSVEQDEAAIVLDSDGEPEEVSGITKSVSVDKQRLNYEKRGAALQSWPFYFTWPLGVLSKARKWLRAVPLHSGSMPLIRARPKFRSNC